MKKRNLRGRLAIAVAFALSLSSLTTTSLQAYAYQGPVNESLSLPFGQVADYDQERGIGFVWGAAGYDLYTVTISCAANGYEKVYPDQELGYHWYPDEYADGVYGGHTVIQDSNLAHYDYFDGVLSIGYYESGGKYVFWLSRAND